MDILVAVVMSCIIAALMILFVIGLYYFLCCPRRQPRPAASRTAATQSVRRSSSQRKSRRQRNDSLYSRFVLQFTNLKEMTIKKAKRPSKPPPHIEEDDNKCSICFEEYTGNHQEIFMGYIKKCGHYFHFDCIWKWLEKRGNCPLCREKVKLVEEDIQGMALCQIYKNSVEVESSMISDENSSNRPHSEAVPVSAITESETDIDSERPTSCSVQLEHY